MLPLEHVSGLQAERGQELESLLEPAEGMQP